MRWIAVAVLALLVASARPAAACDPYWDWCGYDWYDPYWDLPAYEEPSAWWWDEPVYEPPPAYVPGPIYEPAPVYVPEPVYAPIGEPVPVYEPIPVYVPPAAYEPVAVAPVSYVAIPGPAPAPAPAWSDPVVWSAPGSDVLDASVPPTPEPAPVAIAPDPEAERITLGLHWVADAWSGHAVTTEGLVTTFTSNSVAMDTGTAARLIASVGTGENSGYDALLFGGRMALSDGRLVKGDVYANYVWNGYDWVLDRYVFFQDDLEVARLSQTPDPVPSGVPPATAPPPGPVAPMPATAPVTAVIPVPAFASPLIGDVPAAPATEGPPSGTSQPVPRAVRAGIALAPQADPLGRVEVLRGRRVPLWMRATVDGVPARVISWRLLSGELITLGPVSGGGDEPLVATWRSITAPGTAFAVRLRVTVDVPGDAPHDVDAAIEVIVRSPALVD
jgi:hypothetical protein